MVYHAKVDRQWAEVDDAAAGSLDVFGVCRFHTPIFVTISLLLRTLDFSALEKDGVVIAFEVSASFLFAAHIRRGRPD